MSYPRQRVCLYVTYKEAKRKISIDVAEDFNKIKTGIQKEFCLDDINFRIFEVQSKAEISSSLAFEQGNNLFILFEEENFLPLALSAIISLSGISKDLFGEEELLIKVNHWASNKGFQVVYREGIKKLAKGFKRTMRCNIEGCQFKLTFKNDKEGGKFKLDEALSLKWNKYTGKILLNLLVIH